MPHNKSEWRRFEPITQNEKEEKDLERVLNEKNLSRQDLTIIFLVFAFDRDSAGKILGSKRTTH